MSKTTLEIIKANFEERATVQGELRSLDEAIMKEKRLPSDEETAQIEEKRGLLKEIDARVLRYIDEGTRDEEIRSGTDRMLGVMLDSQTGNVVDHRSIGERFEQEAEERLKEFRSAGSSGRVAVEMPGLEHRAATTIATAGSATSAGAWVNPQRIDRVGQDFLDRRVYLADMLPSVPVSGPIEYVQDRTPLADLVNIAAEVAELGNKPQAGITTELIPEKMATIAVWTQFSRQADWDAPMLRGFLDGRLRYALRRRRDAEIIGGNGVGANLLGLANRTGIATVAPGSAEDRAVTVRKAITAGEILESVYEIIVVNPADAEKFDLTNYGTAGLHARTDLLGGPAASMWGLQRISSNAVAAGTALAIDPLALQIFDRMAPVAFLTDSHASTFIANVLTLLLELRVGLGLYDTAGVCKITFNGTA